MDNAVLVLVLTGSGRVLRRRQYFCPKQNISDDPFMQPTQRGTIMKFVSTKACGSNDGAKCDEAFARAIMAAPSAAWLLIALSLVGGLIFDVHKYPC